MFEEISFPEHEYESIQNYLNKLGYCYTTRVYKEIGKYKVGELYTAPWGDVLRIDEVKTYWKVSDRPFYDEMNDEEKVEICKYSEDIGLPYEFIKFSKSTVLLLLSEQAECFEYCKSEHLRKFGFRKIHLRKHRYLLADGGNYHGKNHWDWYPKF